MIHDRDSIRYPVAPQARCITEPWRESSTAAHFSAQGPVDSTVPTEVAYTSAARAKEN